MEELTDMITKVKDKLVESGLASPRDFCGCSDAEIGELQEFCGVTLPRSYREFLRAMGRGAGKFMQGTDVFYSALFKNRAALEEVLDLDGNPFPLTATSFVFSSHQGYIFHFFDTAEGVDDPRVFGYGEGDLTAKTISETFTEFLLTSVVEQQTNSERLSPWAKSLGN